MRSLLRNLFKSALSHAPRTHFVDMSVATLGFILAYRRLPRRTGQSLPDYFYQMKRQRILSEPLRVRVTDKALVKDYVTEALGSGLAVPTLALLSSDEEIDNFAFPDRCCIKPTHASGAVILRLNGEPLDTQTIKDWLKLDYYATGREVNYRSLKPKIIVEPLIFNSSDNEDLKFFCYNGRAKFVQIDYGRFSDHRRAYFSRTWERLPFSILKPPLELDFPKPRNLDALLEVADKLSAPFTFIRVDLYTNGKEILVGELTNMPENGNGSFIPPSGEKIASKMLFSE